MKHEIIADVKRDHILNLLNSGRRIDGRGFDEYREVSVEVGINQRAEGSALVKLGRTQVMVGVKLAVGEPFPDMPDSGVLTTNAELIPLASPSFERGPPDEDTVELARVVDRAIRESQCIDLEKLCISEGELVWIVFIDLHPLDYDGNLFDACTLGAIAALKNAVFPKLEDGRVDYKTKTEEKLPIVDTPVEVTFAKIGDHILVDPCLEEEEVLDARLTIGYNEKGEIVAMQKGGSGTFTQEEILDIVRRGREKAEFLRKHLPGDSDGKD
ncbi:MAG: exosome complex protein Rrp42 [Euryarchaeota archaeon]|nr:exosome complex protein Rrp42 [Euryarchaeota archaeon]